MGIYEKVIYKDTFQSSLSSPETNNLLKSPATNIEATAALCTSFTMKTFIITTFLALTTITIACPGDFEKCGWRMTGNSHSQWPRSTTS